jgi:hypothetical protein
VVVREPTTGTKDGMEMHPQGVSKSDSVPMTNAWPIVELAEVLRRFAGRRRPGAAAERGAWWATLPSTTGALLPVSTPTS